MSFDLWIETTTSAIKHILSLTGRERTLHLARLMATHESSRLLTAGPLRHLWTAPNFCICDVFCHSECLSPCVSRLEIATARLSGSVQYSNVRTRRRQFPLCAAINLYSSDRKNRKDFAPEAFIFCTTVSSGLLRCSILADRQNSKQ